MSKRFRRNHSPAFRAKVAVEALKGRTDSHSDAECFDVHPTQATQWKTPLLDRAAETFGATGVKGSQPDIKERHAKIGQQALEIDFLAGALGRIGDPSAKR